MIEQVDPHKLKPHPKNPNSHSKEQIERLMELIEYQGFRVPIIVSKQSNWIISGHGRVEAAIKMKLKEVPVLFQDFKSEEQEYAFLVSDNAISEWSELDLSQINSDVIDLGPDFNVDLLGLENFEIDIADKLEHGCDEDEVPETKESFVKLDDIWTLGNHRLMCGDSTNIDSVDKLMNGEKADMVFTSPPYNANTSLVYKKGENGFMYHDKKSDNKTCEEYLQFNIDIFKSIYLYTKDNSNIFYNINYNKKSESEYIKIINKVLETFNLRETIVWKKTGMPSGGYHLTRVWEFIFFFTKHKEEYFQNKNKNDIFFNYWEISNIGAQMETHRACFPVALPEIGIERYSPINGLIFEPFGGAGTTSIACEKKNRKCFMMEIDPHYCSVIIERWQKYTGKKAELVNG